LNNSISPAARAKAGADLNSKRQDLDVAQQYAPWAYYRQGNSL